MNGDYLVIIGLNHSSTPLYTIFFLNKMVIPRDLSFYLFFRVLVVVFLRRVVVYDVYLCENVSDKQNLSYHQQEIKSMIVNMLDHLNHGYYSNDSNINCVSSTKIYRR